jgi:hypothetical protein
MAMPLENAFRRVFTAEEQSQAHCQVGNLSLAVSTISDWMLKIGC